MKELTRKSLRLRELVRLIRDVQRSPQAVRLKPEELKPHGKWGPPNRHPAGGAQEEPLNLNLQALPLQWHGLPVAKALKEHLQMHWVNTFPWNHEPSSRLKLQHAFPNLVLVSYRARLAGLFLGPPLAWAFALAFSVAMRGIFGGLVGFSDGSLRELGGSPPGFSAWEAETG